MKPVARKIRNTLVLGIAALYMLGWSDFVEFMHQEFVFKLSTWAGLVLLYLTYKATQSQIEGKS